MIILYKIRLRPKIWMVDSGFVVNLERKNGIRFLNRGGASDDCNSIQENF